MDSMMHAELIQKRLNENRDLANPSISDEGLLEIIALDNSVKWLDSGTLPLFFSRTQS